ncbi:MAG: hypothetical protein WCF16_00630 [Alphaproteobacteria bacterium]
MTETAFGLSFAPLFSWPLILAVLALGFAAMAAAAFARPRGYLARLLVFMVFAVALANPTLTAEEREPRKDIAVIVVDESPSQSIGKRAEAADNALANLRQDLARFDNLEVRVVHAGAEGGGEQGLARDGTYLFDALDRALSDVPRRRLAGAVMITDGEVHDAPKAGERPPLNAPLHVLLTGHEGERDRRLVVEQSPRFGLVGQDIAMTVRVEDEGAEGTPATLRLAHDGGAPTTLVAQVGQPMSVPLSVDHRGENVFELEVEPGQNELTLENNRAVVVVNGVRDRLRVLLVSGEPYPGERIWRNLLKSDPSVDLVHFTILRPPEKQDGTPVRELSLIAFPIRELFEVKLREFDLVIFDHYRHRGLLPQAYYENIVQYVNDGGAVLEVAGPDFASEFSLYRSALSNVLPGAPTGTVTERGFRPKVTAMGARHPVTAELTGAGTGTGGAGPSWGRWFRQIDAEATRGQVLMEGVDGRPILVLDRFGAGRVAQLLSDQIWLWARGFENGGPHGELMRRLAHWLMKEPELEEESLTATVQGNRMEITRHSLERSEEPVQVRAPSGALRQVPLTDDTGGRQTARIEVTEPGLYRLSDGKRTGLAAVGSLRPVEFSDVRTTAARLAPVAEATGGAVIWLGDRKVPEVRRTARGRPASGGTRSEPWIGLIANGDHVVRGVREVPLLPPLAMLLLALGALALAWRREGM